MEIRLKEDPLRGFCENILKKTGLSQKDAVTVTDSLLFANLRGIDSHGIMRLPFYVQRLTEGATKISPAIRKIKEKSSLTLLDGDEGMGQVVGAYAAELALEKARKTGVSVVGVKGSGHYGVASYYAVRIAEAGMIGISISNSAPVMAAWGGAERVIGNNPLSVAVPYEARKPIVLDIAMSRVAGGKVRLALKNNKKIPKGWIITRNGNNTENPTDFIEGGALLPFAAHKGYGLAIMVEILAGVLTGAGMLRQIPLWFKEIQSSLNIGHCFAAIDIGSFMDMQNFKERLAWMIQEIKSSPLAKGFKRILMPGEIELEIEERRKEAGIPISKEIWGDLEKLSEQYGEPLKPLY